MVFMPLTPKWEKILKRLILLGGLICGCSIASTGKTPLRQYESPGGREVFGTPNGTHFFTKENISNWTPSKIDLEAQKGNVKDFEGIQWTPPRCEETGNPVELFQYNDAGSQYKWSQFPKDTSGIYRYLDKDGVCIYIGKAKNIRTRMGQHARNTKQAIDKFLCKHPMHRSQDGSKGKNDINDDHRITCEYITVQSFREQWNRYLITCEVDHKDAVDRTNKYTYHYMEAYALWIHMSRSTLNAMPKYNIKRDWRPYALHKTPTGKDAGKKHRRHKKSLHEPMTGDLENTVLKPYTGDASLLEETGYEDIRGYDNRCDIFKEELRLETVMFGNAIWGHEDPKWVVVEKYNAEKMAEYRKNEEMIEAGMCRMSNGLWLKPPPKPTTGSRTGKTPVKKRQEMSPNGKIVLSSVKQARKRKRLVSDSGAKRSLAQVFANATPGFKKPLARSRGRTSTVSTKGVSRRRASQSPPPKRPRPQGPPVAGF